ncbi:MAG: dTMP kinase [Pirellulales bacterium]|nr:dTMP kinase [Pirellulales bacterium]
MFLSIDGIDGAGKSTQLRLLVDWLENEGHAVVECRDPGSTGLGEAVRELLLGHHEFEIHRRSEMLLYMAARAQLVEEVIRPALAAGKWVVSDRFLLANVVYQGHAGGLDTDTLWNVGQVATAGIYPNRVLLLDMPVASADQRMNRDLDRMESQGDDFRQRLRDGFLAEADRDPERIICIDASRTVEQVHGAIRAAVTEVA